METIHDLLCVSLDCIQFMMCHIEVTCEAEHILESK